MILNDIAIAAAYTMEHKDWHTLTMDQRRLVNLLESIGYLSTANKNGFVGSILFPEEETKENADSS